MIIGKLDADGLKIKELVNVKGVVKLAYAVKKEV